LPYKAAIFKQFFLGDADTMRRVTQNWILPYRGFVIRKAREKPWWQNVSGAIEFPMPNTKD
jgi:hypothetical protein